MKEFFQNTKTELIHITGVLIFSVVLLSSCGTVKRFSNELFPLLMRQTIQQPAKGAIYKELKSVPTAQDWALIVFCSVPIVIGFQMIKKAIGK